MNFQELAHKALQGIIPERAEPHLSLTNGKCQRNHRGSESPMISTSYFPVRASFTTRL